MVLTACQPQATATPETAPVTATKTPQAKPTPTSVPPTPTTDPSLQPVGDLTKGIALDPALAVGDDELLVNGYLYRGLVRLGADGKPAPDLADSWTVSDDELDIVFYLRRDAAFSDGTPIDADVVVANFYRWFDPNDPLHGSGTYQGWKDSFLGFLGELDADGKPISVIDGLEKQDTYTVLLHLNRRDPDVLVKLAQPFFGMVSPAILEAGSIGISAETVISSGPYVVAVWDGEQLLLEPNASYWGEKAAGKLKFGWK